jgi:hypothetical protein
MYQSQDDKWHIICSHPQHVEYTEWINEKDEKYTDQIKHHSQYISEQSDVLETK